MTSFDKWWARIKYVEDVLDYVPVRQISECNENWEKCSPFQPEHLTDFVCNKVYVIETVKFNYSEDDEPKIFFALIGELGESEESLRKSKTLTKWAMNGKCEMREKPCKTCEEIMEAGTENIAKRRKTTKPCCAFMEKKTLPLLQLLSEFKTERGILAASILEQFELAFDQIKNLKKRLYTDLCVYSPRFDDPYLPLLRATLINCFKPIEKCNEQLKLKSLAIVDGMKDIQCEVEDRQLHKIAIPSVVIVFLRANVDFLRKLEAVVSNLNDSFDDLMAQILEMEERLIGNFIDVHNFVTGEEEVDIPDDMSDIYTYSTEVSEEEEIDFE